MLSDMLLVSVQFATLGGLAGVANFLLNGEFTKPMLWTFVAAVCIMLLTAVCILLLTLAMKLGDPRDGKPRG